METTHEVREDREIFVKAMKVTVRETGRDRDKDRDKHEDKGQSSLWFWANPTGTNFLTSN